MENLFNFLTYPIYSSLFQQHLMVNYFANFISPKRVFTSNEQTSIFFLKFGRGSGGSKLIFLKFVIEVCFWHVYFCDYFCTFSRNTKHSHFWHIQNYGNYGLKIGSKFLQKFRSDLYFNRIFDYVLGTLQYFVVATRGQFHQHFTSSFYTCRS